MSAGVLGCIVTPKQGNRIPEGATFCADNGVFGKGYPGDDAWWEWVKSLPTSGCAFVVAPDVVADSAATLARSMPWLDRIRSIGKLAAFVAQDGAETVGIPWNHLDVLFIGGSTEWKLGSEARAIVVEAKKLGKSVHMGRVNSARRMRYAAAIGVDSVDGTFLTFGPDQNMPKVIGWLREAHHPRLWEDS